LTAIRAELAQGAAVLITGESRWLIASGEARYLGELWRLEQIENRRRQVDLDLYLRANTLSLEEERRFDLRQVVLRARNDPPQCEVLSGQALNALLGDLTRPEMQEGGRAGPAAELSQELVRHLNFARGPAGGAPGMLKGTGRLVWPVGLCGDEQRPERELLDSLVSRVASPGMVGGVDEALLTRMRRALDTMSRRLTGEMRQLPTNQYIEARRYLAQLRDSLRTLSRPDAADCLRVGQEFQGRDAIDLVRFMTARGLRFGPAGPGDEPAYRVVHQALAALDAGHQAPNGSGQDGP
jgi:hypothetical protein